MNSFFFNSLKLGISMCLILLWTISLVFLCRADLSWFFPVYEQQFQILKTQGSGLLNLIHLENTNQRFFFIFLEGLFHFVTALFYVFLLRMCYPVVWIQHYLIFTLFSFFKHMVCFLKTFLSGMCYYLEHFVEYVLKGIGFFNFFLDKLGQKFLGMLTILWGIHAMLGTKDKQPTAYATKIQKKIEKSVQSVDQLTKKFFIFLDKATHKLMCLSMKLLDKIDNSIKKK